VPRRADDAPPLDERDREEATVGHRREHVRGVTEAADRRAELVVLPAGQPAELGERVAVVDAVDEPQFLEFAQRLVDGRARDLERVTEGGLVHRAVGEHAQQSRALLQGSDHTVGGHVGGGPRHVRGFPTLTDMSSDFVSCIET